MSQPLDGVRVIELAEGVAGPYAGKLLADYGADVIKIEPPGGDRARQLGPFHDEVDPETGGLHLHLNTNKRSVVGRPGDPLVDQLIEGADIVLQSSPEPDPAELRQRHPGLVVVTVTSFGLTGPWAGRKGEEIVHFAVGGPMSASGDASREPLKMGADIGQYQCGTIAAVGCLAGLARVAHSGSGTHIDLSNVETQIASIDRRMTYLLYAAYRGEDVERPGGYNVSVFPGGCRPSADGHVQVSTLSNWIPRMLEVTQDPELAALFADPGWLLNEDLPALADGQLLQWTLTRNRQEAMEQAQAAGWPVTAVNRPVDLLTDAHFEERGFFVDVDHPVAGPTKQAGPPIRMADGWRIRRPAPQLGEHTEEVRAEAPRTRAAGGSGDVDALPLAGVRVLDMTVVWAGPYATQLLGDLGADIVRVDNPWIFPSATRGALPRPTPELVAGAGGIFGGYPDADPGERPWNRIALFNAHARNKRSVTVDLRQASGREALLRLVEECDVMVENNSVDLIDKLGIGWDELHARNPRLILVRMPSVGLSGPYRSYLGFGVNFEALCGLGAIRGYRETDLSESESVFHMDAASGSAGAFAALAALRRRGETGVGEMIELSQSENMLNHIGELVVDAGRSGRAHEPLGNRHRVHAPQGCYPCVGDDQWVVLSVTTDEEWAALRQLLGDPDWARDPSLDGVEGRRAAHDSIDEHLAAWSSGRSASDAADALQAAGVPAGPVLHETEALAASHFRARGLFAPNGNEDTGIYDHPTHVWRWDGPALRFESLPVLGEHNEEVYRGLLGLSDEEYAVMVAEGHIHSSYLGPDGASL